VTSWYQFRIAIVLFVVTICAGSYLFANISAIKRLNPSLSSEYIQELNEAFNKASDAYGTDKDLLIAMAWHESSFKSGVKGDNGKSWGIMQVGKQGRKRCGYSETVEGQIMSGACWLNEGVKWCGDIKGGLTAYACGVCSTTSYRCNRAVKRRLKLMEGMKK
jgi:hypothetical protein